MKSLAQLRDINEADTLVRSTSFRILVHLDHLPEQTAKASSGSIKKALKWTLGSNTWTNSMSLAAAESNQWILRKHSFERKVAADFGFDASEDG
jgi:hypothetical protein